MFEKICTYCQKPSYSSANENWICPYCGKDISNLPVQNQKNIKKDRKVISIYSRRRRGKTFL